MYRRFFGLSESPFSLLHDRRFVLTTRIHGGGLDHLEDGLAGGQPLTVLLGHPGLGKTTLLKTALRSERCRQIHTIYVSNPTVFEERLADVVLAHLTTDARPSLRSLDTLRSVLRERRFQGLATALVVDEAESLTDERLEEVSALIGLRTKGDDAQMLPVVLAGQPSLRVRLAEWQSWLPNLATARSYELAPMALAETASYILSRARAAGVDGGTLFTREAVLLIHQRAGGIPRNISVLCDNALLTAFGIQQKPATRQIVDEVCRRFELVDPEGRSPRSPGPGRRQSTVAAV